MDCLRTLVRRTPHGVRGLKFEYAAREVKKRLSHPAWGAWIEMAERGDCHTARRSHPAWGAWIEIRNFPAVSQLVGSHPAWGAWIEISSTVAEKEVFPVSHPAWGAWIEIALCDQGLQLDGVAPRMGCVD